MKNKLLITIYIYTSNINISFTYMFFFNDLVRSNDEGKHKACPSTDQASGGLFSDATADVASHTVSAASLGRSDAGVSDRG